ncbi:MAG: type VI protein secretion system component VasK [Cellvibrionaceae bacterium]|jgi:type VI protein secretion system component VasK
MQNFVKKLGILPWLLLGPLLAAIAVGSVVRITDTWPFEPNLNRDLVRAIETETATAVDIMEVVIPESLVAFLFSVALFVLGLAMPLVYLLNQRFFRRTPTAFDVSRQSLAIGGWAALSMMFHMNRVLSLALVLLIGFVIFLFEFVILVRLHARRNLEFDDATKEEEEEEEEQQEEVELAAK